MHDQQSSIHMTLGLGREPSRHKGPVVAVAVVLLLIGCGGNLADPGQEGTGPARFLTPTLESEDANPDPEGTGPSRFPTPTPTPPEDTGTPGGTTIEASPGFGASPQASPGPVRPPARFPTPTP